MVPFKPAEIRIIVFLSVLALAGSVVTIMQRQGHLSKLNLGALTDKSIYNYSYSSKDISQANAQPSQDRLTALSKVPEAVSVGEKLDLNHAGLFDFEALPGIGPVIAQRIIDYRDSLGNFHAIDDLKKVSGIGPVKFALIKDKVKIE
jgi:competence ComEA-like helix-hairpin-helix protein